MPLCYGGTDTGIKQSSGIQLFMFTGFGMLTETDCIWNSPPTWNTAPLSRVPGTFVLVPVQI